MPDLLDKLNVLVRASLNSVLSSDTTRRIPPERLGKDIDGEISALRKHIDDALNTEDDMQKRLDAANAQIADLDKQADQSLLDGDDANARYLVGQMQRQKQQAAMLQANLEDHRRATSELIERVNTLEAMVSDARRNQAEQAPPEPAQESSAPLSNLLRDARQRIDQAVGTNDNPTSTTSASDSTTGRSVPITIHRDTSAKMPDVPSVNDQIKTVVDQAKVEDDLAARRARLSKPDEK